MNQYKSIAERLPSQMYYVAKELEKIAAEMSVFFGKREQGKEIETWSAKIKVMADEMEQGSK